MDSKLPGKITIFLLALSTCLFIVAGTYSIADSGTEPITQLEKTTRRLEISTEQPQTEPEQHYFNISLSNDKQAVTRQICEDYGVPFDLIIAIMAVESDFNESAISYTDDYGIMQINKINHEWLHNRLGVTDFLDFEQNVECGVFIMSGHLQKYNDVTDALMSYNCGESGAAKLWKQGIKETDYTRKVLKARESLEWRE